MRASCVLAAGVCGMVATEAFVINPSGEKLELELTAVWIKQ